MSLILSRETRLVVTVWDDVWCARTDQHHQSLQTDYT